MLHFKLGWLVSKTLHKVFAELPGAITTVLSRSQAPTRRMLVDPKGLGTPPVFSGREEDFYVWTKKVENCVFGVFRGHYGSRRTLLVGVSFVCSFHSFCVPGKP